MKRYLNYLKYILKHKWYVWKECKAKGLYWQGFVHDLSKFLPDEFIPYAKFFYNPDGTKRTKTDKVGYYKISNSGDINFDMAWARHCKRNRHHWQYWCAPQDYDGMIIFDMPEKYVKEAVCDWVGASLAQGFDRKNIHVWYKHNRNKCQLSNVTAKRIALELDKRK